MRWKTAPFGRQKCWILVLLAVIAWPLGLCADVPGVRTQVQPVPTEPPPSTVGFRMGSLPDGSGTEMCLEIAASRWVSFESCGTGAGFLYPASGADLAHFRFKAPLGAWHTPIGWLVPQVHAGFAELEIAGDQPGFRFTGTGSQGVETAGPEAGVSLRLVQETQGSFELITELLINTVWLPYADQLKIPQPTLQTATTLNVGLAW